MIYEVPPKMDDIFVGWPVLVLNNNRYIYATQTRELALVCLCVNILEQYSALESMPFNLVVGSKSKLMIPADGKRTESCRISPQSIKKCVATAAAHLPKTGIIYDDNSAGRYRFLLVNTANPISSIDLSSTTNATTTVLLLRSKRLLLEYIYLN